MRNRYSVSEILKNIYSLVVTKIFFSQARFIRRPIYIRGKKSLIGAKNLTTGRFCRFDLDGRKKTLRIGENCEMGDMTHIVALDNVEIGNNVLIASKCFISDTNHGNYKGINQTKPTEIPKVRPLFTRKVKIGDNVWIGENVVILAGAEIGAGCIIGANSLVNKKIPENCIAVGSPVKIIKLWNEKTETWEAYDEDSSDKFTNR